jgi:uncharacterized protein DUF3179
MSRRLRVLAVVAVVLGVPLAIWLHLSKPPEEYVVNLEAAFDDAADARYNGFDLSAALIPTEEVHRGAASRNTIRPIDTPQFMPAREVDNLREEELVVGVNIGGEARAYPLRVLDRHEVVNEEIGGLKIVVTYCPLCASAMVFDRRIGEQSFTFGISGLLYNSDVLMFDRETESLWSQLGMKSVAGPSAGETFTLVPSTLVAWATWQGMHPDTQVLIGDARRQLDYEVDPYEEYRLSDSAMYPFNAHRDDLPEKTLVYGILMNGQAKAYPESALADLGAAPVEDAIGPHEIELTCDEAAKILHAKDLKTGEVIPVVRAYWFAWQAFHPDTELYRKGDPASRG